MECPNCKNKGWKPGRFAKVKHPIRVYRTDTISPRLKIQLCICANCEYKFKKEITVKIVRSEKQ